MSKRRDPVSINSVGLYMQSQSDELKQLKSVFEEHVKNILNNYNGVDAKIIVSKFLESAAKLNSLIQNLDYYANYMVKISSHDSDNLNNTKRKLETIKNQYTENVVEKPLNQTINLKGAKNFCSFFSYDIIRLLF